MLPAAAGLFALACVASSATAKFVPPGAVIMPEMAFGGVTDTQPHAGIPVVVMHGLGDSGTNPGMQSLCKTIPSTYPGMYTVCAAVADGTDSFFQTMDEQVAEFAALVQKDPKLAGGFNAIGLSQGNLVIRGYIEKYNSPPVKKFVSICGPMEGVGSCPTLLGKIVCPLWKLDPYGAHLAFSGYWKDVTNRQKYIQDSVFMADVGNDGPNKNETYATNMKGLTKYVLIEALNDTVVIPKESAQHGFWAWGSSGQPGDAIVAMKDSEAYKGDWIGLKTLDAAGKIDFLSFEGEHIRFSQEFWNNKVLPYFKD